MILAEDTIHAQKWGHENWHEYFAGLRMEREAALAAENTGFADEEPYVTGKRTIAESELPRSPKAVVKKLRAAGFDVLEFIEVTVHHPAQSYRSDSAGKRAEGTGHSKGESKFPEKDVKHITIGAIHPKFPKSTPLAVKAFYENGGSKGAIIYDPVGIPVELYFEYTASKNEKERLGVKVAEAAMARVAAEHNDGQSYLARKLYVDKAKALTEWLDEWVTMLSAKEA